MVHLLELDALGDELLLDDDSSYLDEASSAPAIPEGTPGERSTNRVMTNTSVNYIQILAPELNVFVGVLYF